MIDDRLRTKRAPLFTRATDDLIVAMMLAGRNDLEMAEAVGRTHAAIRNRLTRLRRAGRLPPACQPKP